MPAIATVQTKMMCYSGRRSRSFFRSLSFSFAMRLATRFFKLLSRRIFKTCVFAHQLFMHEQKSEKRNEMNRKGKKIVQPGFLLV